MKIDQLDSSQLDQVTGGTRIPYLVKDGDTLKDIAAKNNCTVEDILRWNNLKDTDKLLINQRLILKF